MSNDTNKLDLSSSVDNYSFNYDIRINSAYTDTFDAWLSLLSNIGRKSLVKNAIFDQAKAIITFSRDDAVRLYSKDADNVIVNIFYPQKDSYASSLHLDNIHKILNHCFSHFAATYIGTEIPLSSYKFVNDELISFVTTSDQVVYSTAPAYISDYTKITLPTAFCNYFSNPIAGHFSPHYQYANNTIGTCCSNKLAFPNADSVPSCYFSDHSTCNFYSPDEVKLDSVSSIDNINSTEAMVFELFKSRYTDSTLRYKIVVNSKIALEQSHQISPDTNEEEIEDSMRTLFHQYVDDISHDKKAVPVSVDLSKKRSFISTITK
jgi:hypothetical protein